MPKRTSSFREDLLADLIDPVEAAMYLNAALDDSEQMFLVALRDVADARHMAKVAEEAGVARESIYRMLTATGNPTYGNLTGILRAVGLRLAIQACGDSPREGRRVPPDSGGADCTGTRRSMPNSAGQLCSVSPVIASIRKDMAVAGSMISDRDYPANRKTVTSNA